MRSADHEILAEWRRMLRSWVEPSEAVIQDELIALVDGNRLVAQALARRGIVGVDQAKGFLDPHHYFPSSPYELPGMSQAVERLQKALKGGEHVLVWGDFDVDGQTSTALLVQTLKELGGEVSYHIPVRSRESHGMSWIVLENLLKTSEQRISIVLTCDTGIAEIETITHAQKGGVDVVVTDHHEIPVKSVSETGNSRDETPKRRLPPALAVVTPRMLPVDHPLVDLPGVGIAYKLAEALYSALGNPLGVEKYLDLTALGIVADVAQLSGDTRYLLQRGLEQLRGTQRLGLQAIYERAGIVPARLTEEHIGFILGPRLNAIGRLSDANPAVDLLITEDRGQARQLALELEGLNARRQLLTSQVLHGALAQIEQDRTLEEDVVLILSHPSWEAGIIGIVASRLVEMSGKPVALISSPPEGPGRGSARSVPGVDITAAIGSQGDLLYGYGGHKMAAGFTIDPQNIPEFRKRLSRNISAQMGDSIKEPTRLQIDDYLDWGGLNVELAESIERLAPFGPGNPSLVLATRDLHLSSHTQFGRQHEHLQLIIDNDKGIAHRVLWWGGGEFNGTNRIPDQKFDLAYTLRIDNSRGEGEISIQFVDFRIENNTIDLVSQKPIFQVMDFRRKRDPFNLLIQYLMELDPGQSQIWVEGAAASTLKEKVKRQSFPISSSLMHGRDRLDRKENLIIWTAPPGRRELLLGLEQAVPERVVLFGLDPGADQPEEFLNRLAGIVKHVLSSRNGIVDLLALAAATAQQELTVKLGLEWLEAAGHIRIVESGDERSRDKWSFDPSPYPLILTAGGDSNPDEAKLLMDQLKILHDETIAYRDFFRRMKWEEMLI
jgi:single-stranded-DNA-specific exonuclease